jgi:surfeit locus 1 family protein
MTRRMIAPLLFGVLGVAILVALGAWQVQRLAWKTEILDRIDARLAAAPVAVPATPDPAADQYLRVRAEGAIGPGELHVYTTGPRGAVGYRVIAPLELAGGRRILLDRGFVPIADKDAPRRLGPFSVEGSLSWPRETDGWTSAPDRDANIWFARDVPLMAGALATEPLLLVVATSDPAGPVPMPVTASVPNNHLQYAITWFGLAVVWTLMTGYLLWRIKRRID